MPENSEIWNAYNLTADGFLIVGGFNEFGIAEGIIEAKIGKIKEIRLHIHTDSENWAILSEVNTGLSQQQNNQKPHSNVKLFELQTFSLNF